MKKLLLLFVAIIANISLIAQNPDDLVISGYVTNSNGSAVANHQVCVVSDSLNPNPFNQCVNTNANGWYTITVTNGSLTGSNQTYKVYTIDCNNNYLHQYVSNNQGTVNAATVNFTYCQASCDASFTYQVNGLTVSFVSSNTGMLYQHHWDLGNGTTASGANATVTYSAAGTYTVCHTLWNTSCADTVCMTITVGNTPNCLVSYTYNTQGLLPNQVQFNGILTSGTGTYNWYWHFGDGTTGTGQNPLHQYAQPGLYSVCVYLSQSGGTMLCSYCDSIYIQGTPNSCQASFTFQQSGNAVSFNSGNSIFPSGTVLYTWDFGDGNTSTLANPVHTFANPGTYNVCLTITTTNNNCTDTYCHTITIGQSNLCNISFTFAQNPNGAYVFTPTFPSTINNPQFYWDFGDGGTSTLQNPVHHYVNTGIYTVCLTISGNGITCTYCDSAQFNGSNLGCNASFTYQISGLTVTFTPTMLNTNTNHYWNFGNGTTANTANATVTFTSPGTYTVCHHVWNTSCSDTSCIVITVGQTINCNVSFTYNTQNLQTGQVQFFGQIQPATGTYYWHWNFGDGSTSNGQQNPLHQYSQPGWYLVCVNILQNNGTISCSYCDSVYVPQTPPIPCNANFTYQQSGATVHFYTNNSGISPSLTMHYYWDFGDGTSSSLINPVHTYTSAGTYNVCLTVSDSLNNCYDQFCQTIVIGNNTNCQASFQFTYGSIYNVAFFGHFTPLSTSLQWYWSFGDSTFANVQNPIHSYPGPGTYQVCLTVISPNCPAVTSCQTITIQGNTPNCHAYYTYQVSNMDVHFSALSNSLTPNQFMFYYWDFDDGTSSNLQNPVHTFANPGTYNVCLTIIDSLNGCTDQFCQSIVLGNNVQLSGQIFCGNNPADMGTVYLLIVTPGSSNGVTPIASTPILANGMYQFANIPYGQYLIQAHLSPNSAYFFNYLPTYYGDVLYWSQANFVTIGQVNLTIQYDIHMIGTNLNNSGNGQISGNVLSGTGNKSTLSDILVVLLDEFNEPLTYTYSDANGYFEFKNLPWGNYNVYAEVWGLDPISANIILDEDNPDVDNIIITVNDLTVVASIQGYSMFYFDFVSAPYPNPAKDVINIDMSLKQNARINLTIYNIMGVSVISQNADYSTGVHHLNFNLNNLPAGLYYVDLLVDNKFRVSKLFNKLK